MSKHSEFDPENSIQSQGGKARSEKLSPEKRAEIATKAAASRWNIARASHGGTVTIGRWTNLQCYNVEVEGEIKRLISAKSFMTILDMEGSAKAGAKKIAWFLDNPFIPPKRFAAVSKAVSNPIRFLVDDRLIVEGYEGEVIIEYCKAMMQARRIGALPEYALPYAEACEIVVLALAGVAIAALIDEATGYQEIRERKALESLLDRYLQKEFSAWAKRFPDDFYKELFRLRGWEWKGMRVNRPQCVGRDTKDLVYERLEVGILKELEIRNPWVPEKSRRVGYHHCLLTHDFGIPALAQHLHTLITIMRGFPNWRRFKEFVDISMPKKDQAVQFLLQLDDSAL